jgi:hypothetical protein
MALGKLGARGGFGSLGALGRAGGSTGPAAPVMALVGVVGSSATFSFDLPTPVAGDTLTLQARVSGASGWGTLVYNSTHTITQPEIDSGNLSLTAAGLSNGNYEASSIFHHTTDSARSNIVSFTVAAGLATARISSTGNQRISSAGNYRKYA